jgi:hypothetical protein
MTERPRIRAAYGTSFVRYFPATGCQCHEVMGSAFRALAAEPAMASGRGFVRNE